MSGQSRQVSEPRGPRPSPARPAGARVGWRVLLAALLIGLGLGLLALAPAAGAGRRVELLPARGVVNPVLAGYILRGIERAQAGGAEALIIQLDTPGGLDTSMREIIQAILAADVPVVVYVAPAGGRAASAGVFITLAAPVAAMAPSTSIGAAHPVSIGGGPGQQPATPDKTMTEKVTNDAVALVRGLAERRGRNADWAERAVRESVSATADEALRLGVVDVLAADLPSLLAQIDGRDVTLAHGARRLQTTGAVVEVVEMSPVERLLHLISDPNVAYILLTLGVYGLIYELASPGAVLPGVVGVLALVLAFFSLGMLPISYAGLGLILFGFALLVGEVLVAPGVGALGVGGIASLALGSLLLLGGAPPYLALSPWVVGGVLGATAAFFLIVIRGVTRSLRRPVTVGVPALVGARGVARNDLRPDGPEGLVFVDGELWRARAEAGEVPEGSPVEVVGVVGLRLVVRRAGASPSGTGRQKA